MSTESPSSNSTTSGVFPGGKDAWGRQSNFTADALSRKALTREAICDPKIGECKGDRPFHILIDPGILGLG